MRGKGLKYLILWATLLAPASGYPQVDTDGVSDAVAEAEGSQLIDAETSRIQRFKDALEGESYNAIANEAFSFILFGNEEPHFTFLQIDDCTFYYSQNPGLYALPRRYRAAVAYDLPRLRWKVLRLYDVAFDTAEFVGSRRGGWLNPYARLDENGQTISLELDCIVEGCSSDFHPFFQPEHTLCDRVSIEISSHPSRVERALDDLRQQCSDGRRY